MASFADRTLHKTLQLKTQILWIIVVILSVYFIYHVVLNASRPSHGFASYYTAAKLLIDGEDVTDFYNDDWFSSKVEDYVPGVYEIYLINMPTTALILLPIANFDYKTAKIIWTIFNLLFLTVVIALIISRMKLEGIWLPFVFIILYSFQPLYANISFGQVYIFIFCFFVLAWFAYESGNEKLVGIMIGLVFIFKTAGVFLLILFALKRKWKSLLWFFITVLLLFIATLPFLEFDSWLAYGDKLLNYTSRPTLSVTAYQTIHSFFHHFFVFDAQWNHEPLIDQPIIGKSLTIVFSTLILVISIISAIKNNKPDLPFGTFIIVGIILSPASIDYHYMLMFIPILILYNWLIKNPSPILWIVFAISFIFIAASIPYMSPKISGGLWAVFAYPKLYGALGLWCLFLRVSYLSKSDANPVI